jgi:hypothetical protein
MTTRSDKEYTMNTRSKARPTRKLIGAGLLATGILLAAPAGAAGHEDHYFAFLNVGDSDTSFRTPVDVVGNDDTSFELGFGYAFNRYLSVQGSYHDFGSPTGVVAECPPEVLCVAPNIIGGFVEDVSFDGWSAALRGTVPINENLALFGTLGAITWDASARHLNDSGTDLIYGAGVIWNFAERWGVQFSYEKVDLDIETGKLGILYRF